MKRGRKSLATTTKLELIKKTLEQSGSVKEAYEVAGISEYTFHKWVREKPEFAELVAKAKAVYSENCRDALKYQAEKVLEDYLYRRTIIKVKTIEQGTSDKHGDYLKEINKEITPAVPRWVIERILGRPYDEIDAVKSLVIAEWLPAWVGKCTQDEINNLKLRIRGLFAETLQEFSDTNSVGITAETAAAIKAHLWGIQPADVASVSAELESGQQPDQDL